MKIIIEKSRKKSLKYPEVVSGAQEKNVEKFDIRAPNF